MNNDVKTIVLRVNGDDAQKKINDLTKRIEYAEKAKEKLDKVASSGGEWTAKQAAEYARMGKEIDTCRRKMAKMKGTAEDVNDVLKNLSGASVKDLNRTLKTLQSTLNSGAVARGSKEWDALTSAIRKTKEELSKIRQEQEVAMSSSDRLAEWGNKWMGIAQIVETGMQVYDAAMNKIREYVDAYADMQEAQSQVIKYTGMTAEQVDDLNNSFMAMDTRTPREKLNALAGDAGRLGITAKDKVLEFVEAADQINVALGEDLGEDAVKQLGKLSQLFGDDKTKGLKGAMLATGSVINELAQTSSASEPYLVDFTARLAGVGVQANMTQAQIMAYASILDQSMVSQEKGATALQNVLVALYRKPAQMAKLAGLDVAKFTQQLKTDGNAALLTFIQALNSAGNMDALAPMLDEMKLSGAGVTQTLSALANNIDKVRVTQTQATQAFAEATSVTGEFAKANSTPLAQMEKAHKRAHDLAVALGQELYPVMTNGLHLSSSFLKLLLATIPVLKSTTYWVWNNKGALVALAVSMAAIYAITKAQIIAERLGIQMKGEKVAWTFREVVAEKGLWGAIKATTIAQNAKNIAYRIGNGYAKAKLVVTGLVKAAYMLLTGQTGALTVAQTALNVAMSANPAGALVAVILTLVSAVTALFGITSLFSAETEETNTALAMQEKRVSSLTKAHEAAAEEVSAERAKIEMLTRTLNDNNLSLGERQKALDELKRIVPGYNAQLSSEGKLYNNNTSAIDQYIDKLEDLAMARAVIKELEGLKSEELKLRLTRDRKQNNLDRSRYWLRREQQSAGASMVYGADGKPMVLQNATAGTLKQQQAIDKHTASLKDNTQALDNNLREQREVMAYVSRNAGVRTAMIEATTSDPMGFPSGGSVGAVPSTSGKTDKKTTGKTKEEIAAEKAQKEKLKRDLAKIEETLLQARATAMASLAQGAIDLREYEDVIVGSEWEATKQRLLLYAEGSEERINAEKKELEARQRLSSQLAAWSIADAEREQEQTLSALAEQHARGLLSEEAYNQARNAETLRYLQRRRQLYQEAGDASELEKAVADYDKESSRQKEEAEKAYLDRIRKLREKFAQEDTQKQFAAELADLDFAHAEKLLSEEAYQQALARLRTEYSEKEKQAKKERDAKDGWGEAKKSAMNALPKSEFATELTALAQAMVARRQAFAEIDRLEQQGVLTHEQAEARKVEITNDKMGQTVMIAQAAYAVMGSLIQGVSQLAQASYEADAAKVTARYDAEIKAVGESTTRGKLLEQKKQKELAEMKTKANKRAMSMQMAQALAQIPITAMTAYNSAAATPIVGPVLAPIAAAAAVAAGMIQVATIKKQHEAQSSGYYVGGFTGGTSYRREAGIVHEGEFVANHHAVNNSQLLPVLRLIDHAQRTNTVASLTAEDVSRSLPVTTATAPTSVPVVVSQSDPRTTDAIEQLNRSLAQGITATVSLSGPDGFERQWKRYQGMTGKNL